MTQLLKGKPVAEALRMQIREKMDTLSVKPVLATVRAGERADDIAYERSVCKQAEKLDIGIKKKVFKSTISQSDLVKEIEELNKDDSVHGVLIFRPLPDHIDEQVIADTLSTRKDIDGITPGSLAGVFAQRALGFPPCTARACMELLKYYAIDLTAKKVTVVGRSLVVGKPAAIMAAGANGTVTICHSKTEQKDFINACKQADVLIVAMGKARYINEKHVSQGQTIIDVGIHADENGNLCGDVDFISASKTAKEITPVPGGIGTVTTAVLMLQVVEAAQAL